VTFLTNFVSANEPVANDNDQIQEGERHQASSKIGTWTGHKGCTLAASTKDEMGWLLHSASALYGAVGVPKSTKLSRNHAVEKGVNHEWTRMNTNEEWKI
jgi:hypothetical protein